MHGKSKEGEQVQCVVVRVHGEVFVSHHPKNAAAINKKLKDVFLTLLICKTYSKIFLIDIRY
jgi:hypothetical protein